MEHLKDYKTFEKKQQLKRVSEEEIKKEQEKKDKNLVDNSMSNEVEGIKTEPTVQSIS